MDKNKLQRQMDDFYRAKALREQLMSSIEKIDALHLPKLQRYISQLTDTSARRI